MNCLIEMKDSLLRCFTRTSPTVFPLMNPLSTTPVTNKNLRVYIELLFTFENFPIISTSISGSLFFNLKFKL